MKEKAKTETETTRFRTLLRTRIHLGLSFGLIGAVAVFASSVAWATARRIGPEGVDRFPAVVHPAEAVASPVEPAPEPTELARRLDGVIVPKAAANLLPVAVMYDNNPAARPHAGLAKASVVYNTLVEGGATRLMALFDPEVIVGERLGPVRSSREAFLEWLSEYDGLYVHAGGSPEALQMLSGFGLRDLDCLRSGAPYCFRDRSAAAPHNLYTDGEKLAYAYRDLNLSTVVPTYPGWRFKDDDALEGRGDFQELEIRYSSGTYNVRYAYNRTENVYERFHLTDPHRDRTTGKQIKPKNILVQVIPPIVSIREKGRLTLNVTGEGKALLFRDGLVIPGKWKKPVRTERTVFVAEDGTEMKLNRGQTFVEIVPDGREFPYR